MFSTDPIESASEAGLRYVRHGGPCIQRVKHGKSFRYIGPDGRPLRDDAEGRICRLDSTDVNRYIRELAGTDFTAKDFRTWAGTLLAARELHAAGPADGNDAKKIIVSAIKEVARCLGNRPATCRKYYIHPAILDAYSDGSLFQAMERGERQDGAYSGLGLRPEEYSAVEIIAKYQESAAKSLSQRVRLKAAS